MNFSAIISSLWWRRRHLILFVVFIPTLFFAWSIGQKPMFKSTTTLHFSAGPTASPVLQDITASENLAILHRTISSNDLILDSLTEVGVLVDTAPQEQKTAAINAVKNGVKMSILGRNLVRINLKSETITNVDELLEALSFNFVEQLLAPERFRIEQQMGALEHQIKSYSSQIKLAEQTLAHTKGISTSKLSDKSKEYLKQVVALEFEVQRLSAQQRLAEEEYNNMLKQAQAYKNSSITGEPGSSLIRFAEPPVKLAAKRTLAENIRLSLQVAFAGLLVALITIKISRGMDSTLRRDEQISSALNLKVLGHLPNLGKIQITPSGMRVEMANAKEFALQPTNYTEINRLYRTVLGDEKGSLVITSTQEGEGTSIIAFALAQRAAEAGRKVLLIDLNLKDLDLTQNLKLPQKDWNLDKRKATDNLADLIEQSKQFATLSFMAAPADEASIKFLKDADRAERFLKTIGAQFDHVIVDTSPITAYNRANADSVILASAADHAVVSLLAAKTPGRKAVRAVRQLQESNAPTKGVIVNNFYNPSLQEDIMRAIAPLHKLSPGLHDWLRYKISNWARLSA